jgi:hypothetical protein
MDIPRLEGLRGRAASGGDRYPKAPEVKSRLRASWP